MKRSTPWLVAGLALASTLPLISLLLAGLWSAGIVTPDPNGAIVQSIEALWLPALVVSPLGLVLAAWGVGVRTALGWIAAFVLGLPVLAVVYLAAAICLGGLAGEPF
ncbi:MAG TPA: hypothetical protein VF153_09210 [Candidatus Limnocylindria bacterium]